MRKMKYWKALAALVLIAALLCGSAMAASMGAKAVAPSMTIYNSGKRPVGTLSMGTSFKVTSYSGKWARISYKGNTYFARLQDIAFDDHIKAVSTKDARITFVTKSSYRRNVYYTATLSAGVTLYVAGIRGDDFLFFDETGNVLGYVPKSAVRRAN